MPQTRPREPTVKGRRAEGGSQSRVSPTRAPSHVVTVGPGRTEQGDVVPVGRIKRGGGRRAVSGSALPFERKPRAPRLRTVGWGCGRRTSRFKASTPAFRWPWRSQQAPS